MATLATKQVSGVEAVLLDVSEMVLTNGKAIQAVVTDGWQEFSSLLSPDDIESLARAQLCSMASARLTSGFSSTAKNMVVRPRLVGASTEGYVTVSVRFFTEAVSYGLADGSRKKIINCDSGDFDYLLRSADNRIRGLVALKDAITQTVQVLGQNSVRTIADLPEADKVRVDQLWKNAKCPQLEEGVPES
jgi:hypothetical protein